MTENKLKGIYYLRTGLSKATIELYIEEMITLEILQRDGDKLLSLV